MGADERVAVWAMDGYGNLILISWDITPLTIVIYTHLSQCLLIELSSALITFIEGRCGTVKEWA